MPANHSPVRQMGQKYEVLLHARTSGLFVKACLRFADGVCGCRCHMLRNRKRVVPVRWMMKAMEGGGAGSTAGTGLNRDR